MVLLPKNAWWDTVSNTTWAEKLPIFHSEDQIEWGGIDLLTRPSGHQHFKNECRRAKTKEAMWIKTLWSWEIPPPLFVYVETQKKLRAPCSAFSLCLLHGCWRSRLLPAAAITHNHAPSHLLSLFHRPWTVSPIVTVLFASVEI